MNKSRDHAQKLADLDSHEAASDNINDLDVISARHNMNALNPGTTNFDVNNKRNQLERT